MPANSFELEQHYPDGMIVHVTYAGIDEDSRVQLIKEVKWSGRVVILPIGQLRRWRIWIMDYCPKVFILGKYRLHVIEFLPHSHSVLCVRDNALWWWLPLRSWVRRQRDMIYWRILLTLKVWNLMSDVDTSLSLDDQRPIWLPAWRKKGKRQ